jgi:hypothetical protein
MDKNILLGGIIFVSVLYLIYIYQFENSDNVENLGANLDNEIIENLDANLDNRIIENLENTIVHSKYHKRNSNNKPISALTRISTTIKSLPSIHTGIDLNEYEFYNNVKNHIIYWIGKKKAQLIDKKPVNNNNNNNKIMSTLENYYQYAKKGMVNILTNGSKNEKEWTVIEKIDSDPSSESSSDLYDGEQKFEFNIVFWFLCILLSIGIVYVIVVNGEYAFKSMGIYKLKKSVELPSDNSELNSLDSPYKTGGSKNNIYYIGGYDSNLYSD